MTGVRALDAGGTAVDACVAMAASMAVLAPMATGMGGDAFMLHYDASSRRIRGLNGSGGAPAGLTLGNLRDRGVSEMPARGGLTATVPGAVRMWEDVSRELGRLPLSELLEPARGFAEEGFPVSEVVSRYWKTGEPVLRENAAATRTFLPEGRAPLPGEIFRQPELARTLAAVMEGGADAFYGGEVGRSLACAAQEAGGFLDEGDLAAHHSLRVEPISTDYRGIRVYEIPPPGQGIAALEMLNILEGFDFAGLDPMSAERIHLEVEAKKLAFADLHSRVGDPRFVEVPTEKLISKEYASELRERISLFRAGGSVEPQLGYDTTYLCAVDAAGNGCSFINSLFSGFGSGVVADGTGVCLQSRGASYRLVEGHPNAPEPGKRPLHTIIPGLATRDDELWATFGVMGGPMQPQGHAQLLVNLIDYGMNPQQAVDHPRHFHSEGTLLVKNRLPETTIERLRDMGHEVEVGAAYGIPAGGAQLIRRQENGVLAAGSDPRKDGCALAQ